VKELAIGRLNRVNALEDQICELDAIGILQRARQSSIARPRHCSRASIRSKSFGKPSSEELEGGLVRLTTILITRSQT
jgi:hypothetical protein